jgi:NAD-dependent SIR2 family protein deacetylase
MPKIDKSDEHDQQLAALITPNTRVMVLSGAGCSTASGLGDYRDKFGEWKRTQPITGHTFRTDTTARHRYWARSSVGWPAFDAAQPSLAHTAIRQLEQQHIVESVVTQNVDRLHQKAGQQAVTDLHGVLATVSCLDCSHQQSRNTFQSRLINANPWLQNLTADYAPDGDADLHDDQLQDLTIPACEVCSGMLKPDVVFFGENVPKDRVALAMEQLRQADVLLVAGSSLMVYSGFRFCRDAQQRKQPIVIVNDGITRADDLATLKIGGDCGQRLHRLALRTNANS